VAEPKEAAPTVKTIEQALALKTSYSFDSQSLEFAMRDLGEDVRTNLLKGAPVDFQIKIIGDDLKLDGITRNQSVRDFKQEGKTVAEVLTALVRKANPVTTVKDPSELDQKLLWVVGPDPDDPKKSIILITTRQMAEKKKYTLPDVFKAKLNYLTGTDAQGKVWKEVQRHMLPVCVRDVPPCNVRELSTQEHAADAEGQFLLVPTKDKSTGHYEYSGFGYYRESLKLKNQASVPVVWAVELRSVHQHSLGDTWHGNIEIPLAATQYGQGNTLSFIIKLRLGPHGTFEPEAPIFYGDTQIATVYNISSDPHFLSSMP